MAKLTWHGHATFSLVSDAGARVLIDPFLDNNPKADIRAADVQELDYILCTHGHGDHFSDAISIANRTGALFIANYELVGFAKNNGLENGHGMGIGGSRVFDRLGRVKLTPALHGGAIDGAKHGESTTPCGFVIDMDGKRVYHAGDTALIMDMQLLQGQVDVALLPIGDNYTMGPVDAARAVEFIRPKVVIPMHYNTFDLVAQDPDAFAKRVGSNATTVVLQPGQSYDF